MNMQSVRFFSLVPRGGPGLSCDAKGVALGGVPLAFMAAKGAGHRAIRTREELEKILDLAYGEQPSAVVSRCLAGLVRVTDALAAGDLAKAAIEAVLLSLPDIPASRMGKLSEAMGDFQKNGTSWQDQPRIPAGQHGGGEWTSEGGSGGAPSSSPAEDGSSAEPYAIPNAGVAEVNPATAEDIANRDYHDEVVAKIARIIRKLGCAVITEIPLTAVDGLTVRADILMQTPEGVLFIIEVKTGVGPKYEDNQRLLYPMAMLGGHVFSMDSRIVELGFEPGERLPPMGFDVAYKRDKKTRLQIISPGGQVIAESPEP